MIWGYQEGQTRPRTACRCLCDCGNECIKIVDHLRRDKGSISCGCMSAIHRAEHQRTNEVGQKFGRLTIIDIDWGVRPSVAICRCDCGRIVRAKKAQVVCGKIRSCGCLRSDRTSEVSTIDFTGAVSESGVELISRAYQNSRGVWMWNCLCPLCGEEFIALPAKILANHTTSCGCKRESSGERIITTILDELHVDYQRQYRFPDCKDCYTLPFDFAIRDASGVIHAVIEYDGQQHDYPVDFFGGQASFEICKRHDAIKSEYCEQNHISLLRLSYRDNVQNIKHKITNIIYP